MRTIPLFGALLLLSSCGNKEKIKILNGADDSSPIIISDGSILFSHEKAGRDHLKNIQARTADVRAKRYQPIAIGYLCDPSANECTAASTCSPVAAKCQIDLSKAQSWSLRLCENTSPCAAGEQVLMNWPAGDGNTMHILSNNYDLAHIGPSNLAGAKLHELSGNHLQSARLMVDGQQFDFDVSSPKYLNIQYHCKSPFLHLCDPSQ